MKRRIKNQKGQAIVEYIIIIVIVAVAAFALLGIFSDRIRTLLAGATNTLGGDATVDQNAADVVKDMDEDGLN
ncbi:MAG: hypothetical protein MST10_05270 [Lentisphaeria bacterium]|nr:hypothetical protein [Lentisphaeria bacterium]